MIRAGIDMFANDEKNTLVQSTMGFFLISERKKHMCDNQQNLTGAKKLKTKFHIELCTVHLMRTGI